MPWYRLKRHYFVGLVALSALLSAIPRSAQAADSPAQCQAVIGRIVSIQGKVSLRRGSGPVWTPVSRLDTELCEGDLIHTAARSRAAVVLQPETILRVDQESVLSLRVEEGHVHVEMMGAGGLRPEQVGQVCGAVHFITRFPRRFKAYTPFLNAAVEGTEFQIALACDRARLAVFEGQVRVQGALQQSVAQLLATGQEVSAESDGALSPMQLMIRPVDAVQWALFYPVLSTGTGGHDPAACAGLEHDELLRCRIGTAEALLRLGRVDEAGPLISKVLEAQPDNSDALALQSTIALARNEHQLALDTAARAAALPATTWRALLALSYARQSDFDLPGALAANDKALALHPGNALLQARRAELLLSLGALREAADAAEAAVKADGNVSRTHIVHGFVLLARLQIHNAHDAFQRALALDSSDPLTRVGLGLVAIRQGNIALGREHLEIAVSLDPANALLRSYLGKAYYEENSTQRDGAARDQFNMAKKLDPRDPTPHLYDALLLQAQNRPVDALQGLSNSISRNDNRAVYRSRLLLDQDASTRSVSLARTYRALGFDRQGALLATDSLIDAPENHSAHRFLSDSYAAVPGHEIARNSELLKAKLLQPISAFAPQPCMAEGDILAKRPSNPEAGYAEHSELFERDGIRGSLSGALGDHGIRDGEVALGVTQGRAALGLSACQRGDDGFRENQSYERTLYTGSLYYAATADLQLQAELSKDDREFGDVVYDFDPAVFSPTAKNDVNIDTTRLGAHLRLGVRSHLIASIFWNRRINDFFTETAGAFDFTRRVFLRSRQLELQYIGQVGVTRLIVGMGAGRMHNVDRGRFRDFITPDEFSFDDVFLSTQFQAYVYGLTRHSDAFSSELGVTFDRLNDQPIDQARFNPKIGLRWKPAANVTLRAAFLKSARRFLAQNQTIEPTQVAGFNQFFDDFSGARVRRAGVGVDWHITSQWFAGIEASRRELEVPFLASSGWMIEPQREKAIRAYLYGSFTPNLSVTSDPVLDRFERDIQDPNDNLANYIKTFQWPVTLRYFISGGWVASLTTRYVRQEVDRLEAYRSGTATGTEKYVLGDVSLSWRAPGRKAVISLEVRNLTDRQHRYQDLNLFKLSEITPSSIFPERTAWVRASLLF